MRLIIAGSRGACWDDILSAVHDCKTNGTFNPEEATEVVSGRAKGADREGEAWAIKNKIVVVQFPAEWEEYGRRAGHIRNTQMANYGTHLLAVWDGSSPGTKNMIETAKKKGLEIHVFQYDD